MVSKGGLPASSVKDRLTRFHVVWIGPLGCLTGRHKHLRDHCSFYIVWVMSLTSIIYWWPSVSYSNSYTFLISNFHSLKLLYIAHINLLLCLCMLIPALKTWFFDTVYVIYLYMIYILTLSGDVDPNPVPRPTITISHVVCKYHRASMEQILNNLVAACRQDDILLFIVFLTGLFFLLVAYSWVYNL